MCLCVAWCRLTSHKLCHAMLHIFVNIQTAQHSAAWLVWSRQMVAPSSVVHDTSLFVSLNTFFVTMGSKSRIFSSLPITGLPLTVSPHTAQTDITFWKRLMFSHSYMMKKYLYFTSVQSVLLSEPNTFTFYRVLFK